MTESERRTGDWMRDLADLVDKKDQLINELYAQVHKLQEEKRNRTVVAYMHPQTKRIIDASVRMVAEQHAAAHRDNPDEISRYDREKLSYSVPAYVDIDLDKKDWS